MLTEWTRRRQSIDNLAMASSASALAAVVSKASGRRMRVVVNDKSGHIARMHGSTLSVVSPLLTAPLNIQRSLGLWIRGDRASGRVFASYISDVNKAAQIRARRTGKNATSTRGSDPVLLAMQKRIGAKSFKNWHPVHIYWGPETMTKKHKVVLGHYETDRHRIAINPIFKRRDAPRAAMEHVVFHEMTHHDMPGNGDHPPAFMRRMMADSRYPAYKKWARTGLVKIMTARIKARS